MFRFAIQRRCQVALIFLLCTCSHRDGDEDEATELALSSGFSVEWLLDQTCTKLRKQFEKPSLIKLDLDTTYFSMLFKTSMQVSVGVVGNLSLSASMQIQKKKGQAPIKLIVGLPRKEKQFYVSADLTDLKTKVSLSPGANMKHVAFSGRAKDADNAVLTVNLEVKRRKLIPSLVGSPNFKIDELKLDGSNAAGKMGAFVVNKMGGKKVGNTEFMQAFVLNWVFLLTTDIVETILPPEFLEIVFDTSHGFDMEIDATVTVHGGVLELQTRSDRMHLELSKVGLRSAAKLVVGYVQPLIPILYNNNFDVAREVEDLLDYFLSIGLTIVSEVEFKTASEHVERGPWVTLKNSIADQGTDDSVEMNNRMRMLGPVARKFIEPILSLFPGAAFDISLRQWATCKYAVLRPPQRRLPILLALVLGSPQLPTTASMLNDCEFTSNIQAVTEETHVTVSKVRQEVPVMKLHLSDKLDNIIGMIPPGIIVT